LAWSFGRDIVPDMPVDEHDSTAVTEELPPLEAGRVGRDPGVFSGRARPVVLSDMERALIDEADDPRDFRARLRATDRGDLGGDGQGPAIGPGGQPLALLDERRPPLVSLIAHGAIVLVLAIPAMLMVALGIAVAAR
jgi:hypothetical protein